MINRPTGLDREQIWTAIGAERLRLAGLLDGLADRDWEQTSLCDGWTIRDVAAHLTLQELGPGAAIGMMLRYRGDTDRAIGERARQRAAAWSTGEIVASIRATAGSRRHNFAVTHQETLIDILVHAQDIAIPLSRVYPVPPGPAAVAATRMWTMRWPPPFPARRAMERFRFTATDADWSAGQGPRVEAPIGAIMLLSAGRLAALPSVSGPGAPALAAALTVRPPGRSPAEPGDATG
jgi:uncharacterized protein (TIGR03083 family)